MKKDDNTECEDLDVEDKMEDKRSKEKNKRAVENLEKVNKIEDENLKIQKRMTIKKMKI